MFIRYKGVEWSGVEWSGVEWSGVEWSGVEWSGVEWSGVEWKRDKQTGNETEEELTFIMIIVAQYRENVSITKGN